MYQLFDIKTGSSTPEAVALAVAVQYLSIDTIWARMSFQFINKQFSARSTLLATLYELLEPGKEDHELLECFSLLCLTRNLAGCLLNLIDAGIAEKKHLWMDTF